MHLFGNFYFPETVDGISTSVRDYGKVYGFAEQMYTNIHDIIAHVVIYHDYEKKEKIMTIPVALPALGEGASEDDIFRAILTEGIRVACHDMLIME